jgi:hypothetical protein
VQFAFTSGCICDVVIELGVDDFVVRRQAHLPHEVYRCPSRQRLGLDDGGQGAWQTTMTRLQKWKLARATEIRVNEGP